MFFQNIKYIRVNGLLEIQLSTRKRQNKNINMNMGIIEIEKETEERGGKPQVTEISE